MVYPIIVGAKTTTPSTYGGDAMIKLHRLLSNFDLGASDPTDIPQINTDFRFRNHRLQMYAGATNFTIKVSTPTLAANATVTMPTTLSTSIDNEILFGKTIQNIENKNVDVSLNSFTNIRNTNIAVDAAIANAKLAQITDKAKLPNDALYTTDSQAISNKIFDIPKNTVLRKARSGAYSPTSRAGHFTNDTWGVCKGMVGVGTEWLLSINTGGKFHQWQTPGNVVDDVCGVVKLDAPTTYRLMNTLIRFAFRLDADAATTRMFKGWTSQRLLTLNSNTAPLLSTESGFLFGYGAGDTVFSIFHNDGLGTCVKTPTTVPLPGINTNYILEIKNNGASFTWTLYAVDGNTQERGAMITNGTGTISTRTPPSSTTPLYFQDLMIKTTAVVQQNYIHYVEVD